MIYFLYLGTRKKHLAKYIKSGYNLEDYPLKRIDVKYINGFIYFLKTEQNLLYNSALKYVAYFKKIIRVTVANGGRLDKDPFYNFKLRPKKIDKEFLSKDEIIKLIQADFSIPRLAQVRDVFMGRTGFLRKIYINYNIVNSFRGIEWIQTIIKTLAWPFSNNVVAYPGALKKNHFVLESYFFR